MYDYRKMTPTERIEVLACRRAREYPLHAPPRGVREEGCYLLTAACFEHQHIFDEPALLSWLSDEILNALTGTGNDCRAWCFQPNHYHVLLKIIDKDAISEVIRRTHSRLSTRINSIQHSRGRQVWCQFSDRNMRNDHHYWATVNYLRLNPVKHKYVDDPDKWPWSSWPNYVREFGSEWLCELQQAYPLYDYGKGWDW